MGRAVAPPNHGASAPRHHTQAASRRARARCRWFARLGGGRNESHQKIERGASALALGGRLFKCLSNNQMGDGDGVRGCVGEEARLGQNVWGGRLPVVWGIALIEKNRENGRTLGLRWPPFDGGTQQPTESHRQR